MAKITMTVEARTPTKIDVDGVQGKSCLELTEPLIKQLGGDVVDVVKKPEIDQTPAARIGGTIQQ